MLQNVYYDYDGKYHLSRSTKRTWGDSRNSISMDTGPTYETITDIKKDEIKRCNDIAPWHEPYWHTNYRNALEALILLLQDHLDCECVSGYSNYHYKLINDNDIEQATIDDDGNDICEEWNIDEGERYYIWPKTMVIGLKGDDSKMPKWPLAYNNVAFVFLFAYFWNCGLAHCKYSSICTLISGLSSKSKRVQRLIQNQCADLFDTNKIAVYSHKKKCYCCYNLKFYWCSDWIFECSVFGLSGPTSTHFLHGLTKFENGKPKCIPNTLDNLWDAYTNGIEVENYHIDFDECRRSKFDGYCLTNNDIIQYYWVKKFQPDIKKRKRHMKIENWNNPEKQVQKRRQVANAKHVPILYNPSNWRYNMLTDCFHAFDTYVLHLFKYMVFLCHSSFDWTKSETMTVVDSLG